MKLSKIKFALVIGFIERQHALNLTEGQIQLLDNMIDVDVPQPQRVYPDISVINHLIYAMSAGQNKIEAIKAYRTLTGMPLKESKRLH